MGLFKRRPARLPADIQQLMTRFGRHEYYGLDSPDDPHQVWAATQEPLLSLAMNDPNGFVDALAEAILPSSDWAAYGAAHTVMNLVSPHPDHLPSFQALMNASIAFQRASGVPPSRVTGNDWKHWLASGGTVEDWLPIRPLPDPGAVRITPLSPGEVRRVALMGPDPTANALLVQQPDEERFEVVIDAPWSADNPERSQSVWMAAGSLYALYCELGRTLQVPPHWSTPELEPFFPLPPPRI